MEGKTMGIPSTNGELVARYGGFVGKLVQEYNRRHENYQDILQSVWLRLIQSDVVGKFHARSRASRPTSLTTLEVVRHLAISFDSWVWEQAHYMDGSRRIPWMPTPQEGHPCSDCALWGTDDIERYEETVHLYHDVEGVSERLIPKATAEQFRTYLQQAVHNAFANWCRTHSRRHKERVVDVVLPKLVRVLSEDGTVDPFETLLDSTRPVRNMEAAMTVRHVVSSMKLGDHESDFMSLVHRGYSALEAAHILELPVNKVRRIERVVQINL